MIAERTNLKVYIAVVSPFVLPFLQFRPDKQSGHKIQCESIQTNAEKQFLQVMNGGEGQDHPSFFFRYKNFYQIIRKMSNHLTN